MKSLLLYIRYWGARILFFGFIALLISIVFFLRMPEINSSYLSLTNPIYVYTIKVSWWLYLLMYFVVVFFINSLIFIFLTVFIRFTKIQSEKRHQRIEHIITDKIMEIIYEDNITSPNITEGKYLRLQKIIGRDYAKIITINILRKIHLQSTDYIRDKTVEILNKLKIRNLIFSYLYSPYFSDKISALQTISEFSLHGYDKYIIKLTKRKNYVLRTEAFVTLIKLAIRDDLSFLLKHKYNLSIWDMNIVLKIFKDKKINNINYSQLIESERPRVAALGVLLANKHNRTELKDSIIKKIGNENKLLNFEAYSAFISMANSDSDYKLLVNNFANEDLLIKRAIVKSFVNCQSIDISKAFLIYVIENERLSLKIEAMKLLLQIDVNKVNEYKNTQNIDILKARNQIVDFNLN